MPLPRCFFDISINGIPTGRVVFELFTDECPKTCQNFKYLCTGEKGEGKTTFKPLHYKGTPVHRIVKGFIIQGGDFENGDGSGGESIFGGLFKDENFKLKHTEPFLLSMANKGPNTNGSQYFITTRPAPHLDGVHVVFGRVVAGSGFVTEMENQKIDSKSRPYADIRIANCGELVLLKKGKDKSKRAKATLSNDHTSSSSDEDSSRSDSSSEEERRRRKKRRTGSGKKDSKTGKKHKRDLKGKKKKRRQKKKVSSSSSESSSESEGESLVTSTVNDGDIPPEISETSSRKSWLYRYSKSPSPVDGDSTKKRTNDERTMYAGKRETVSSSGRMLKGRGNMRYRTPPPGGYNRYYTNMDQYRRRSRSPDRDRYSRRLRSPDRDQDRKRSRSPYRDRYRKRLRSPDRDRGRKRSRSPDRDRYRKRSRSPDRDRDRKRSRSPDRDRYHKRSRSPDRDCKRSRSPDRDRDRKRSRSLDRDRDRKRSRSPDRDRDRKVLNERNSTDKLDLMERTIKKGEELYVAEDQTPPNYEQEEYWSNEVISHVEKVEGKRRGSGGRGSKWDRGGASSDEDTELTSAYQKVEQTLAEQQFGIGALIGENMK